VVASIPFSRLKADFQAIASIGSGSRAIKSIDKILGVQKTI